MIQDAVDHSYRIVKGLLVLAVILGMTACEVWHVASPYLPNVKFDWSRR